MFKHNANPHLYPKYITLPACLGAVLILAAACTDIQSPKPTNFN